ncbi:MAG: 3'-5' exonuclease [Crocinitomicaceae bacterium]|nr:3'-5' exonuclease [Crocinitomicaceae bacterium]MDG1777123.1 3'-5' exonuclease [Crocinitomicaceae bacterium]
MNIKLKKSLAIFDLEATGLSVTNDRIVEIAIVKIAPDGKRSEFHKRLNPEQAIPKEVSEIHGIYDEDIKDAPTFKQIIPELEAFIENTDIAGYNSNKFDLPMLAEELLRAGSEIDLSTKNHIDVQNIFHKMEQRTLIAAYAFYCNKDLKNAHSAMADADATWEVLDAQISKYDEIQDDVPFLANFSSYGNVSRLDFAGRLALNKEGVEIYNFGKHKGKTIKDVSIAEPGYYGWMMDADFPRYTKQCLKKAMDKVKAAQKNKANAETFDDKLNALKNKFN